MGNNKLYKYLDVNGGLLMLLHQNLQFTKASKLNDPFDCHPALIDFSDVPIKKVQAYPEEVQTALQPTIFLRKQGRMNISAACLRTMIPF